VVKAIIFDFFGVIGASVYQLIAEKIDIKQENIQGITDLHKALDNGYINQEEFFQTYAELTGMELEDFLKIYHDSDKRFAVSEKLLSYIKELKEQGYLIGLLSNVNEEAYIEFIKPIEQRGLFNVVIPSYKYGIAKPDQEIFKLCASKLQVDIGECIMVDDVWANCEGAISLGMQSICYKNIHQFKKDLKPLLAI